MSNFLLTGSIDSLQHGVHDEVIEAVEAVREWFRGEFLLREMLPYGVDPEGTYLLVELIDPKTNRVVDNIHIDHSDRGLFIEDDRERDIKHMMTGKL